MNRQSASWFRRILAMAATVLVIMGTFLAPLALAARPDLQNGTEIIAGDPIDSNDYGSGGSGGSDINPYLDFNKVFTLPALLGQDGIILIVPEIVNGVPVFQIYIIDRAEDVPEAAK